MYFLFLIQLLLLNQINHYHHHQRLTDRSEQNYWELEKVAINDALPLEADQSDAIDNLTFLSPRNASDLISMVSFAFAMQRHLIPLAP